MDHDMQPDVYRFIINPRAGRRDSSHWAEPIVAAVRTARPDIDCAVTLTDKPGHAAELAGTYAREFGSRALVFACGGDGTAREVANGIARSEAAMGILPMGTANDFVRAVMSTSQLDRLLPVLTRPLIRPIDVIEIDGEICLNIASLGFDTKVQRKAIQLNACCRWLGSLAYPLAIVLSLVGERSYPMHYRIDAIAADGSSRCIEADARFILAAICNGQYYGGGFHPAPATSPEDGRLFFCLVDELSLGRILKLIPKYKKGTHLDDPAVHGWPVVSGRIDADRGMLLGNFDGESFARQSIAFHVLPAAMRFAFY